MVKLASLLNAYILCAIFRPFFPNVYALKATENLILFETSVDTKISCSSLHKNVEGAVKNCESLQVDGLFHPEICMESFHHSPGKWIYCILLLQSILHNVVEKESEKYPTKDIPNSLTLTLCLFYIHPFPLRNSHCEILLACKQEFN